MYPINTICYVAQLLHLLPELEISAVVLYTVKRTKTQLLIIR